MLEQRPAQPGLEVSSSWRREGRLCEGCGPRLDLEGGWGEARGRFGSAEKEEKTPFSLFPGHELTFEAWMIVWQVRVT